MKSLNMLDLLLLQDVARDRYEYPGDALRVVLTALMVDPNDAPSET